MGWLSLVWAAAIGWAWVECAAPARWRNIPLGVAVGIGATSFLYFLLLWIGVVHPAALGFAELLLGAPAIYVLIRRCLPTRDRQGAVATTQLPSRDRQGAVGTNSREWLVIALACLALALAGAAVVETASVIPHGNWDAWAIWNLRAKFLAGPGDSWRNAVSQELFRSHPDYPLLISTAVARAWRFSGDTDPALPRALALLLAACVPAILISTVPRIGWLGGALLAASAGWLDQAPSQYADVPLSLYMVATLAAALSGSWGTTAFLASCAAWTKNEGLVFALAFVAGASILRKWRPVLVGALPGLVVVALFKFTLAPPSEYTGRSLANVADPGRWSHILQSLGSEVWNMGSGVSHPLALMAILAIAVKFAPASPVWRLCVALLGVQLAAYIGAYLVTPANLEWQLRSSFGRLLAQIWPSVILVFTARLRTQ